MARLVSCGIVVLNPRRELFMCHATGTARWDLPKGLPEPGETTLQAALREAREETALIFDASALLDLGLHDYLAAKRLHLYAVKVATQAFEIADCHCTSTFPHRTTGRLLREVDAYAGKPLDGLDDWCGPNLRRVLRALDWSRIERLPELAAVRTAPR